MEEELFAIANKNIYSIKFPEDLDKVRSLIAQKANVNYTDQVDFLKELRHTCEIIIGILRYT